MAKKIISSILYTEKEIEQRVSELANQIESDYAGRELIIICVLSGSMTFVTDLTRRIGDKVSVRIDLLSASSYEGEKTTGKVHINLDVKADLRDKDVLIVEDIIDSGVTLDYIIYHLKYQKPKSLKICALLTKPSRRWEGINIDIDYLGFSIDDHFVVGYGLDCDQQYRNLPYIGIVSDA